MRLLLLLVLFLSAGYLSGQDALYHQKWNDPAVVNRIDSDIEKYRKGDAVIEVVGRDGKPVADAKIEVHHKKHEFLFGCNLFVLGQLNTPELNGRYEKAFSHLFNFATLPFYWAELEPEPGKLRYREGSEFFWRRPPTDQLVKWCKKNDITAKGHALMYAKTKFMPDWTERENPEKFLKQGKKHMKGIAKRYKNDIAIWDVANEEMPRIRNLSQWHKVPDDYLAWCFKVAGKLFPKDVTLIYNDGINQVHNMTDEYEGLIKGLMAQGLRIEGMGIQFHTGSTIFKGTQFLPEQLFSVYDRLGKMNLPLYITEITVPSTGDNGSEKQATVAANLFRLWFSTPKMAGVTWWNLGDGTAYQNENNALGGLIDKEMNPKPAYRALDKLINHDWRTNITVNTGSDGIARFRGFHGEYTLTVKAGELTGEFPFTLKSDKKTNTVILKMK